MSATEVLNIQIDPPSPVYNQPFKCALTLDQDDHRNACDLLPLNASPDMEPWDICRIHTLSTDKLTRYYDCFVTDKQKNFVPGPGNYQIVVWNFTGDGETGQITARKNITILAAPPPTPTSIPKPSPTPYIPPPTQVIQITSLPTNATNPTKRPNPTTVEFTFPASNQLSLSPTPSPVPFTLPRLNISVPHLDNIGSSAAAALGNIFKKMEYSVFAPLIKILSNFMKETDF